MKWDILLGVVAGLLDVAGYVMYRRQVVNEESTPNAASWTLWVALSTLNLTTYLQMTGDMFKNFLPLASTCGCVAVFANSISRGKLSRLNGWEIASLAAGIISVSVWYRYHSATHANLLLQASIAISFIPTWRGVWNDAKTERAFPWFVWVAAYLTNMLVVGLRWRGQPQDLAYPACGLVFHGLVGCLALRKGAKLTAANVPRHTRLRA